MKWIYCFLLLGIFSCKNGNNEKDGKKVYEFIQFRLSPETGKIYSYSMVNESETRQEVNEQKFENINKLEIDVDYSFTKDTSSNLQLKMQYRKFKLFIKAMDEEKELDASTANESFNPSDKMFAAFNNAVVGATVDSIGNASNFSGIETIKNKMTEYAGNDEEARQMLNGSIRQYVSDQFFKQSIESSLKAFTNRKIKVGDTIMVSTPVGGELNIKTSVVYKLASIKGDIANIAVGTDITMKDQPLTIENINVNANIEGKQKGIIKLNIPSGLLEESKTELSLKGTMQIMGREVPFKLSSSNRIVLIK